MKNVNQKSMDMVHGPLLQNIILFSIPLMFSYLLQIAFNAADTIVVGKFSGQGALAAVGATGPIVNMLVGLFGGLATGTNIVIAMQIGQGEKEKISKAVHTAMFLAITGGILMTFLGIIIARPVLAMTGTPDDIIDMSVLYMRIYFAGSLPMVVYNFGAAILRSKGDTTSPTIFMTISGILNVVLNLFFVIVLKMGVSGVAIATVISETLSAILVVIALMRQNDEMKLVVSKISPDYHLMKKTLSIGIPAGIQSMMWAISNIAVQSAINSFGSTAVAGNSAAQNIESFVYISMQALSQAAITFTSQCMGAKEKKRIRQIVLTICILEVVTCWSVGAIGWRFGRTFLSFYTNDSAVIDAGMIRMWYVVFWVWMNGVLDVPSCSLRGMGYSTMPTIAMFLGIIAFRLIYIASYWTQVRTLDALYMCFPISWVITLVIMFALWYQKYRKL